MANILGLVVRTCHDDVKVSSGHKFTLKRLYSDNLIRKLLATHSWARFQVAECRCQWHAFRMRWNLLDLPKIWSQEKNCSNSTSG